MENKKAWPKKPEIRKLGTIACNNLVETTPLVWKDELYRFEVIRRKSFVSEKADSCSHWMDLDEDPCLRFVKLRNNTPTPFFAEGHMFGFPWAEGDTMYVVTGTHSVNGCRGWGSDTLVFFRSNDLENWEKYSEVHLPGWKIYNMNIAKKGDTYYLMIEISAPVEECGPIHFTFRFMTSKDLVNWELMPREYCFQRDRYCGSPSIYTFDGDPYFYVGYLEAYPEERYANSIARSKLEDKTDV